MLGYWGKVRPLEKDENSPPPLHSSTPRRSETRGHQIRGRKSRPQQSRPQTQTAKPKLQRPLVSFFPLPSSSLPPFFFLPPPASFFVAILSLLWYSLSLPPLAPLLSLRLSRFPRPGQRHLATRPDCADSCFSVSLSRLAFKSLLAASRPRPSLPRWTRNGPDTPDEDSANDTALFSLEYSPTH